MCVCAHVCVYVCVRVSHVFTIFSEGHNENKICMCVI